MLYFTFRKIQTCVELLSVKTPSKAMTAKTQVFPVPDFAWTIKSEMECINSFKFAANTSFKAYLHLASALPLALTLVLAYVVTVSCPFTSIDADADAWCGLSIKS